MAEVLTHPELRPLMPVWAVVLAFSRSIMSPAATGLVSVFAAANEQGTVLGVA
jgi:hypothetical protein